MLVRWLSLTLLSGKKIKVVAKKDTPIKVKVCTPQDFIKDIRAYYIGEIVGRYFELNDQDKIIMAISIDDSYDLKKEGFVERGEKKEHIDYLSWRSCGPSFDNDYLYLYLSLEKSVKTLRVEITKDDIGVFADKAFPEWDIEKIKDK